MSYVIETTGLTKGYGSLKAVNEVSLNVKQGEIYGFLGLNGAGKTTTIRMILGMIKPFSGSVNICGSRILHGKKAPWHKIGYVVETPYSYPELTVWQNLECVRKLRKLNDKNAADGIIGKLKLNEYKNVPAKNLSLGNSQRLGLAKAMIHEPEILILDEPSNGLDPSGIVEIRESLKNFAEEKGVTVFVSSHNLSEISKIATRIGIIHRGRLIEEKNMMQLENELSRSLLIKVRETEAAVTFLKNKGYDVHKTDENVIELKEKTALERPENVNSMLTVAGYAPFSFYAEKQDLESYFLRMIEGK